VTTRLLQLALACLLAQAFGSQLVEAAALPQVDQGNHVVGAFIQRRYVPSLQDPVESRGRFFYDRGRGVVWRVVEPIESELVMTQTAAYQDGESVDAGPVLELVEALLRATFAGDFEPLERRFRVERHGGDEAWRVELTPIDDTTAKAITRIMLTGSAEPESVTIVASDGARTELVFNRVRRPDKLPQTARQTLQRFSAASR